MPLNNNSIFREKNGDICIAFAARAEIPLIKTILVCSMIRPYRLDTVTDGMLTQDYPASSAAMAPTIILFALAIAINNTLEYFSGLIG